MRTRPAPQLAYVTPAGRPGGSFTTLRFGFVTDPLHRTDNRPAPRNNPSEVNVRITSGPWSCFTNITHSTFATDSGIITFHAMFMSWSNRNRGIVHRMN